MMGNYRREGWCCGTYAKVQGEEQVKCLDLRHRSGILDCGADMCLWDIGNSPRRPSRALARDLSRKPKPCRTTGVGVDAAVLAGGGVSKSGGQHRRRRASLALRTCDVGLRNNTEKRANEFTNAFYTLVPSLPTGCSCAKPACPSQRLTRRRPVPAYSMLARKFSD